MSSAQQHFPVMADEMEQYLLAPESQRPEGPYCDCTAGSGGYAHRILSRVARRTLVLIDRDRAALDRCRRRFTGFGDRVRYFHGGFSRIGDAVSGSGPLAGIVADLGLSLKQINDPGRGFSLRLDGPLDMRFDSTQASRAEDFVNRGSESELADLLYRLADEHHSRRIARAIVRARPIRNTLPLAETVSAAVPRRQRSRIHPATKTFQALRMAVNDEPGELAKLLDAAPRLLAPGGRFVVVSFHSGEDRMVKHSFRSQAGAGVYRLMTRRVVRPAATEVDLNPPSRSARLRAVCRTRQEFTQR
ncbi:MAG: 16S rRNA (cytosine(1402)-N(4))-methyltransferase RsmH [Bryobacterales bacterium]|nr:16S rRNA (cytosine(1402)-N(4))-methyltransferase RsmH [Bryobacterales bacterium]